MPREIYAHRTIKVNYDDDVQKIIDDRPSTCQVYHMPHNTVFGEPTAVLVATFQCRLDIYRPRPHGGERIGDLGKTYLRDYLLLAKSGNDYNGNPVLLEHSDDLIIDGVHYRCLLVMPFPEKIEAVVEHVE